MSKPRRLVPIVPVAALSVLLLHCGSENHEEENPNAEACEHLEKGPPATVTAAATSSATAAPIRADHQRYDVTLVDVPGGKGGFVTFAAATAGDYIFFTSAPVKLTLKTSAGAEVAAESTATSIPECTDVKGRHVYPLQVGTHIVSIGPETTDRVSFVVEPDAH